MLVYCQECTTKFPDELDKCPHCEATERQTDMPKISATGGPSIAGDPDIGPNVRSTENQDAEANTSLTSRLENDAASDTKDTPAAQGKSRLAPGEDVDQARDSRARATAVRTGTTTRTK